MADQSFRIIHRIEVWVQGEPTRMLHDVPERALKIYNDEIKTLVQAKKVGLVALRSEAGELIKSLLVQNPDIQKTMKIPRGSYKKKFKV